MADSNQVKADSTGVEMTQQQAHTQVNINNLNVEEGQTTDQAQNQPLVQQVQIQGKSKFVFFKRMPAGPPKVRPPLGMNAYAQKKTMAQGFMDMALLTANAAQMKLVMVEGHDGRIPFFDFIMALLGLSIAFQIVVGALLLYKSQYNIEQHNEQHRADRPACRTTQGRQQCALTAQGRQVGSNALLLYKSQYNIEQHNEQHKADSTTSNSTTNSTGPTGRYSNALLRYTYQLSTTSNSTTNNTGPTGSYSIALLLYKSQYNIEQHNEQHKADRANNWATGLVMLITVLNVFISAFIMLEDTSLPPGVASTTASSLPAVPQAPAAAPLPTEASSAG
uniref:Uncharacterized protein n=1 Tax=Branchiostoma floridae TaxID=7739 RepID=C3ZC50_BRAFL|eukprot:XP_002593811.1 hypothetical protein BRAFLDRAFT_75729 [Branchiostoma floridae]